MTVTEITGISGQSRSSFSDRLKDEYIPAWEDHVHTERKVNRWIMNKRGTFGLGGKRSLSSVMNVYPQSMGIALFEGDDMPTPRVGAYFQPELFARAIYGRLRWTGHVRRSARRGEKVAWAEPMAEDLRTGRIQFGINIERMLLLGIYQVLATASAAQSTATWTLYGRNARTSVNDDQHKFGAHYLRKNMSVSFVNASAGAVQQAGDMSANNATTTPGTYENERYITTIDTTSDTAPTFTLNAAWPDGGGDETIVVPFRSRYDNVSSPDSASRDSEFAGINGLENLVATAAIKEFVYGVDRDLFPSLAAFVDANGTDGVRPFNEDRLMFAADRVTDDGTGDDPDVVICHRSIRREYVKETKGDRRFEPIQTKKGFAAKLVFQSGDTMLPIETSRDVQPGLMWVLESNGFGWFDEAELQLVDEGERFVSDKDGTENVFVKSGNLATRKPHNNVKIDDIQYSVTGLTDLA